VDFRRVYIETCDEGNQIRYHDAVADLLNQAHGGKRSRANTHAIGIFAAVADHIESHIPARAFDPNITLAQRRLELPRHFGDGRPLGHHLETLADDLAALLHLPDAHHIPVIRVSQRPPLAGPNRNLKFQFGIDGIRNVSPDIPLDPTGTQV